jgi:hypothetical protein
MKWQIISNLHHTNARLNSFFEQAHGTQRLRRVRVSRYADRPWDAPRSYSEFHGV